ncbi:MAG: GNAT family N-acetyltransferase [Gammaproteobacteria bacterium]|nr:GNAT family N-acetyltransferase [Gammaproteobacteria bacterium]
MLVGDRIELVPPTMDLQPAVRSLVEASQQELRQFLPWVDQALDDAKSIENMREAIQNFESFQRELRFFILSVDTHELLGVIGLFIVKKDVPAFEIGYWLGSAYTGRGFMAEAVALLERYAFDNRGAKRLQIRVATHNPKSLAIAERAGYALEGVLKQSERMPDGKLADMAMFAKVR